MAEAEDVLTDVAKHATAHAQALWRRHRPPQQKPVIALADVATRLHLMLTAAVGRDVKIRVSQTPAPPSLLTVFFQRHRLPYNAAPVPATNGLDIMLPATQPGTNNAIQAYRVAALQQAVRAARYQQYPPPRQTPLQWLVYQLLEAHAADAELVNGLPGLANAIRAQRAACLAARPPLNKLAAYRQPIEEFLRSVLQSDFTQRPTSIGQAHSGQILSSHISSAHPSSAPPSSAPPSSAHRSATLEPSDQQFSAHTASALTHPAPTPPHLPFTPIPVTATPLDSLKLAAILSEQFLSSNTLASRIRIDSLIRDWWTGELLPLERTETSIVSTNSDDNDNDNETKPSRSAQLTRRPQVREALDDEDDEQSGMLMFQPDPPEEHAEDPMGMQRPIDRDDQTAAEEFADALSELPEARLVSQPGRPKEVLLSDDPPPRAAQAQTAHTTGEQAALQYPEWDYRQQAYRHPGATVKLMPPTRGNQAWVDETMSTHKHMLTIIRKQFEMLQAQRMPLRRQLDGDDVDLEAFIDACADVRAGLPMAQHVYRSVRPARRDMAITLLIDVSGSTDGWVSSHRRVIDVEREALLLVCHALEGLGEPYSVLAFSGNGPNAVTTSQIKHFNERLNSEIALRIAALEPENYTRTGAALRHATAQLMQQPASHRLLLLLSDGRPNDVDNYEGRYGLEDTRQAITEAKLQGVFPFCLTIDRQAPGYLPAIFGAQQYALLPRPEQLPTALIDWMKRLLTR